LNLLQLSSLKASGCCQHSSNAN